MRDHPALVQLLYKTPAQTLDPGAVRVCDDDVDVVALRFASPVPAHAHSQTAQTAVGVSEGPGYTLSVTMLLGW